MSELDLKPEAPPVGVESVVSRIAAMMGRGGALTRGEVASLRRMDPRRPEAAFYKLEGLVLDEQLPGDAAARTDGETRWAAIIVGLAHLGDLYRPAARLGRALADAQFSEPRFYRLVRADAERLIDELPLMARFLAAKQVAADWAAAARLILSAGRRDETIHRRHLARDYYGAIARDSND